MERFQGQKIKKVMADLKITQQKELVCKGISKSSISAVIKNEMELSYYKLYVLSNHLNQTAKERGIFLEYNILEFLSESEALAALKEFNQISKEIQNTPNKDLLLQRLERLDEITSKYEVPTEDRLQIYEASIQFLYEYSEYEKMEKYILLCMDLNSKLNNHDKRIELLKELIKSYRGREKFELAINASKLIPESELKAEDDVLLSIFYNTAKSYYDTQAYQECLTWLNKTKDLKIPSNYELYIITLRANALIELKEYDDAENAYLNMIKELEGSNYYGLLANAYSNLAYIYCKQHRIGEAESYMEKAFNVEQISEEIYIMNIYFNALTFAIESHKEHSIVFHYYSVALKNAIISDNCKVQVDIYNEMLKYLKEKEYHDDILNLVLDLDVRAHLIKQKIDVSKLFFQAAASAPKHESQIINIGKKYINY